MHWKFSVREMMEATQRSQGQAHERKWDWFGLFTNFRHSKLEDVPSVASTPSPEVRRDDNAGQPAFRPDADCNYVNEKLDDIVDRRNWTHVQPSGKRPRARSYHAATVIGRKMIVVGGESDNGKLNDVQVLHLGKLTWSELGSSPKESPTFKPQQLPPCRGHSLISWGKTVLLVGGDMNIPTEKVTVWSFDLEVESWTKIQAKGEIPPARSGQSVTRAGSILIMFGGEDSRGRRLNDIHVLDLKSLMWLPLHTIGKGPSPRAGHVAAMYDDRYLLVFGGASKSKVLNDLYALDFETMEWSRLKPGGFPPSPRAGSAGVLVGDKWYICGGDQRGTRVSETITLDIAKMVWTNTMTSSLHCVVSNQGLSVVMVQRKERVFLVAFGGSGGKSKTNEVQVLYIQPPERSTRRSPPSQVCGFYDNVQSSPKDSLVPCAAVKVAKALIHPSEQRRTPLLDSPSPDQAAGIPGLVPLRKIHLQTSSPSVVSPEKQAHVLHKEESDDSVGGRNGQSNDGPQSVKAERMLLGIDNSRYAAVGDKIDTERLKAEDKEDREPNDQCSSQSGSPEETSQDCGVSTPVSSGQAGAKLEFGSDTDSEHNLDSGNGWTDSMSQLKDKYERRLAVALKRNVLTEAQLEAAVKDKEEAERNLSSVTKSQQLTEAKLNAALRELAGLKLKLEASELTQEESNTLSNIVHSENLRLEHDLAFLKAVLEETQKELHSTRGVLTSERSRAFQLQMELFELKQRLQA